MIGVGVQRRELLVHLRARQQTSVVEDGLNKVAQGVTTMEELYRVCGPLRKEIRDQQDHPWPGSNSLGARTDVCGSLSDRMA